MFASQHKQGKTLMATVSLIYAFFGLIFNMRYFLRCIGMVGLVFQ